MFVEHYFPVLLFILIGIVPMLLGHAGVGVALASGST